MSEFENNALGRRARNLESAPQFDGYSGVEIVVDDEHSVFAGNRTGRVISIINSWGTQQQASNILASLQGYQYQPYEAEEALLSPAAELGDGVSINGLYSGVFKLDRRYGPLMASNIAAPQDEELDHEYPFEPETDRVYKREIANARAAIAVNSDSIAAEVSRATAAEGTLRSTLDLQAGEISAKVSQTGGNRATFGWTLTASGFQLDAGGKTVMKVTSGGLEVNGKVTATSGYIGNGASGFTITATAIYNGVTSISDTAHNGVYIGTNGIVCGKGAFKVTSSGAVTASSLAITGGSINLGNGAFKVTSSGAVTASNLTITGGSIKIGNNFQVNASGNVTANNMTLNGTLSVGGANITAADLRQGAQRANSGYSSWNGTTSTVNARSAGWTSGSNWGTAFGNASTRGGTYQGYFRASVINCDGIYTMNNFWGLSNDGITYDQWHYVPKTKTVVTGIGGQSIVQDIYGNTQYVVRSLATTTIYYLGRSDIA